MACFSEFPQHIYICFFSRAVPQRSSRHIAARRRHSRWSCPVVAPAGSSPSSSPSQNSSGCPSSLPTLPPDTWASKHAHTQTKVHTSEDWTRDALKYPTNQKRFYFCVINAEEKKNTTPPVEHKLEAETQCKCGNILSQCLHHCRSGRASQRVHDEDTRSARGANHSD